ncbi:uncharacterized protein Dmul_37830 [Desulfococcus multivorans]|nr:uncharacterized protein Dmul_37830 [Desulfococcus multivorans]
MGHVLLWYAKPSRLKGRGIPRRKVGAYIYENLSKFLINVARSVGREIEGAIRFQKVQEMDLK